MFALTATNAEPSALLTLIVPLLIIAIINLIIANNCKRIASRKGLSNPSTFGVLGFLFGLIILIIVLIVPDEKKKNNEIESLKSDIEELKKKEQER